MLKFPRYTTEGKIEKDPPDYAEIFHTLFLLKGMRKCKKMKGEKAFKLGALTNEAYMQFQNASAIEMYSKGVEVKNIEDIKQNFDEFNKILESCNYKPYSYAKMVSEVEELLIKVYPNEVEETKNEE